MSNKYFQNTNTGTRINNQIRAEELRVIDEEGNNLGILKFHEALKIAQEQELDLIEVSPKAVPPVAKIMDFGKYQYTENKKLKQSKASTKNVELKSIQIKNQTSDNDVGIKAKQASAWLQEGHRVRVELYLQGRAKGLRDDFLKERFERILNLISVNYKFADPAKRGPKGYSAMLEKV